MTWLTKTLSAAVLALACSTTAVDGQNFCFADSCESGQASPYFDGCGFVEADLDELKTCLDDIGRGGITVLYLMGNALGTIPSDLFVGMTSLQRLFDELRGVVSTTDASARLAGKYRAYAGGDLRDNQITSLDVGTFQPVSTSLEKLDLGGNLLETLPSNIFDGMTALLDVDLTRNRLSRLPVDAFTGLPSLQRLSLTVNMLTTLPFGIFDDLGSGVDLQILLLNINPDLQCLPTNTATFEVTPDPTGEVCGCEPADAVYCDPGLVCAPGLEGYLCVVDDDTLTGDPHMTGLRGQHTEWSGVDGGWYSLIKDDDSQLDINVRLTAPLAAEFPNRQLVTGLAVISDGHSLVIEVQDPYSVATAGCLYQTAPCLADGGLRVTYDDINDIDLLHPVDGKLMHPGSMVVSAANLPTECTKFGGDKIWAETFAHMAADHRHLDDGKSFEDWVASSRSLAAPEWCAKYISERGLSQVQSHFATFRIQTSAVTVRLNVGVNYQGGGETDWDGRILPDLEFWQMDVGLANLHIGEGLTGILGETSRPILDEEGVEIMEGPRVIRGEVELYRVPGPLDLTFAQPSSPPQ